MLTLQTIYNDVCEHLMTQKAKSTDGKNSCLYRSGNLRCAAGILIPDDLYDPIIEGTMFGTGSSPCWDKILNHLGLSPKSLLLIKIRELQNIHDELPINYWPNALIDFGERYDLEIPEILHEYGEFCKKKQESQ